MYPFIVVKANIIVNDLVCLLERWMANLTQGFFFEMAKEVFHGSVVPAVAATGHGGGDGILLGKDKIRL